jgi:integrase
MATRFVVRFGELTKRFRAYELAYRTLTAWRYETDMGKFDPRDHRRDHPLGFQVLAERFVKSKRHLKGAKKYEQRLRSACEIWQNKNVKEIGYADIEDLINHLKDREYSPSYIYHITCTIKMMFEWLRSTGEIEPAEGPKKFPQVKNVMAYRKIVTRDQQWQILQEVHRLTWNFNPRIYIGIVFLATYIKIRPNELRHIKEKHVEKDMGRILIPQPKEQTPKYIYLLPEDIDLLSILPRSFPELYLFRHIKGNGGAKPNAQFGSDYLQKWWNKACKSLGIEGVSLYPGTRHSSAVDLRKQHSPEAIKRNMGTRSNKAFERYLQISAEEERTLTQDARGGKVLNFREKADDNN